MYRPKGMMVGGFLYFGERVFGRRVVGTNFYNIGCFGHLVRKGQQQMGGNLGTSKGSPVAVGPGGGQRWVYFMAGPS
jgi:hypothetical protein